MIKTAWLWDDEGFGSTRKTILTEDHFHKNAHSRMRVHLGVQVVSEPVDILINCHTREIRVDIALKYSPSKSIILACDRLVDIWNDNYSKN